MSLASVVRLVALAALVVISGCRVMQPGPDSGAPLDAPAPTTDTGMDARVETCASSAECDDGFPCTTDNCPPARICEHIPDSSLCGAGEVCEVGRGCTTPTT